MVLFVQATLTPVAEPDPLTLYADTIHADGWCLKSALVRYAQAEPKRTTQVHALMRRLDAALASADSARRETLAGVVARFEELAATMSDWAADRAGHPVGSATVDTFVADLTTEFEHLEVPEESVDSDEWRGLRSSEGRRPPRQKKSTAP